MVDHWPVTVGMDGSVRVWRQGLPGRGVAGWREHRALEHTGKASVVAAAYIPIKEVAGGPRIPHPPETPETSETR